ncbi:LuxR C-terminal-related transcriptional regulator [Amycolatopsis sp. cg9]|uniref:ATP-binding protein n=1 Tax=Amycolatopsis sp. cg9 TaxID=3238801 RepID=UPI00352422BA
MPPAPTISPREREVLLALADRLTNAEIADRLFVSVRTVESHVSALLRKLAARDRRELAAKAPEFTAAAAGVVTGAPEPVTSFVGRHAERDAVVRLVAESRVTTVLGPGGVGKTRLAVAATEAASAAFPGGAAFVNLVPSRPGSVLESVAAGLGVVPRPQQPLPDAVAAQLAGRALLVLDNCEHVADDVADVITALTAANPRLSVLTTSRERLGVPGETVLQLGPLPAAAALFTERAKAVDPAFEADPAQVAELCRELGGFPLNIELAAARVASLGIGGLRAGLADDPLRVLATGRGGEPRHRSLRSVVEWSHRLLTAEERTALARISRFRHGFDLDAATALSPDLSIGALSDLLGRLVDKSLVYRTPGRWALFDGVARFAREQLESSAEASEITARYRRWAARRAHDLTTRLGGDWRDEFDRIADDLRACVAEGEDRRTGTAEGPGPAAPPHTTAERRNPATSPHTATTDGHGPAVAPGAADEHGPATTDGHDPAAPPGAATTDQHDLAADLARLTYARGFLAEAAAHWRTAADRAPSPSAAVVDLARAGSCAHLLTHARDHYDLLLVAADRAAGDRAVRGRYLAEAVVLAERFRGAGFVTQPVPDGELDRMLAEAAASSDSAHVAVARAWRSGVGPQAVTAEAAAHAVTAAAGDPLLLSAALDARCTAEALAGRPDLAHRTTRERLELVTAADRTDPRAALEVLDAFRSAIAYAVATGELAEAVRVSKRAAGDPALAGHPYWGASGLVTTLALTGRFDDALALAHEMWHATTETGPPRNATPAPTNRSNDTHALADDMWHTTTGTSQPHNTTPAPTGPSDETWHATTGTGPPRNATLGVPLLAAALAAGLSGDERAMARWRTRAAAVAGVATPAGSPNLAPLDAFVRGRVALCTGIGLADAFAAAAGDFSPGRFDGYAAGVAAELAVVLDVPDAEHHLRRAARHAGHNRWTAAAVTRARARLQRDAGLLEDAANRFAGIGAGFEAESTTLELTSWTR